MQVEFLRKFAKWLRHWRKVDLAGVGLTRDTFEAAIVTTEGMIKLIEYSFDNYDIQFFLPGKFQTNDLEKRFGKYRRLCGCNYLVSYKDILEAERKLRIKRLVSTYPHELSMIKYTTTKKNDVDIEDFLSILDSDYMQNFTNKDYPSFMYVCGYAAYTYKQSLDCSLCHDLIIQTKGEETGAEYFDFLQRGGLVVPTENCLYMLWHMNAILDEILRTDNIKKKFHVRENQHGILLSLTHHSFINDQGFVVNFNDNCICGKSYFHLFYSLMKVFANILLNNYRKHVNDAIEMKKQEQSAERMEKRKRKLEKQILLLKENCPPESTAASPLGNNTKSISENTTIVNASCPPKKSRKAAVYEKSKL